MTKLSSTPYIDELTGLPNSKSARMYLDEINEDCLNYALLFIDGDSLGQFNKLSYEHGNTAICEIASVIASSLRKCRETLCCHDFSCDCLYLHFTVSSRR